MTKPEATFSPPKNYRIHHKKLVNARAELAKSQREPIDVIHAGVQRHAREILRGFKGHDATEILDALDLQSDLELPN